MEKLESEFQITITARHEAHSMSVFTTSQTMSHLAKGHYLGKKFRKNINEQLEDKILNSLTMTKYNNTYLLFSCPLATYPLRQQVEEAKPSSHLHDQRFPVQYLWQAFHKSHPLMK